MASGSFNLIEQSLINSLYFSLFGVKIWLYGNFSYYLTFDITFKGFTILILYFKSS